MFIYIHIYMYIYIPIHIYIVVYTPHMNIYLYTSWTFGRIVHKQASKYQIVFAGRHPQSRPAAPEISLWRVSDPDYTL